MQLKRDFHGLAFGVSLANSIIQTYDIYVNSSYFEFDIVVAGAVGDVVCFADKLTQMIYFVFSMNLYELAEESAYERIFISTEMNVYSIRL